MFESPRDAPLSKYVPAQKIVRRIWVFLEENFAGMLCAAPQARRQQAENPDSFASYQEKVK
jgi:hypothetical protein